MLIGWTLEVRRGHMLTGGSTPFLGGQQTERHSYEKCQYEEFKKRVAKMDEIRAAKAAAEK
ncbi:uncharacterized protein Z520_11942 [Fonsecaea multimorphosa CBS 102226]|uniref:Uncharacterized protein n=1 Tax=Fonsecaea multimorphosa CBS 102226 TaxID=1442371 RepID=A0A0D2JPE0_9EURO|nr:uncharacterized protein Z520_11942 [Fonsecaea multimorphosa CBS 102226]KIX92334.1 hypothetical protein Z520_11942 [Fonsecaea multimorphosa CBS 102226]